jgi:uncharacterized membrane protein
MKKFLIALVIISTIGIPFIAVHAQELRVDITTTTKAKVLEVLSNEQRENAFGSPQEIQIIKVEILKGEETGKILTLENDYIQLQKGDIFYLRKVVRAEEGRPAVPGDVRHPGRSGLGRGRVVQGVKLQ